MKEKCITYYFDSKLYNKIEIINNLRKECETQYFGKEPQIDIKLNEFGTYIATMIFMPKENKAMQIIKSSTKKIKQKNTQNNAKQKKEENKKCKSHQEKILTERRYGAYKQTGTFKPI